MDQARSGGVTRESIPGWMPTDLRPLSLAIVLASILHEGFYCNRRHAAATSLTASWTRPGGRACCLVGQHTVSSMLPSRRRLGSEACLAHSYKGASHLVESP